MRSGVRHVRMNVDVPAKVQSSNYGFPAQFKGGEGRWIRARDLYPLASEADRARIESLVSNYQSYSGEAGDVLGAIWARLGWPRVGERQNGTRKAAQKRKYRRNSGNLWRLVSTGDWTASYPKTIPFQAKHLGSMSYDYSGPTYARDPRFASKRGAVYSRFLPDGQQTYMGDSAAEYKLDSQKVNPRGKRVQSAATRAHAAIVRGFAVRFANARDFDPQWWSPAQRGFIHPSFSGYPTEKEEWQFLKELHPEAKGDPWFDASTKRDYDEFLRAYRKHWSDRVQREMTVYWGPDWYAKAHGGHSNPRGKHQHARVHDKSGKVRVVKSVSRGRKIPGYHAEDPLTVPFRERESVAWKLAKKKGYTVGEARRDLVLRYTPRENPKPRKSSPEFRSYLLGQWARDAEVKDRLSDMERYENEHEALVAAARTPALKKRHRDAWIAGKWVR